jgi:hypothetical protein
MRARWGLYKAPTRAIDWKWKGALVFARSSATVGGEPAHGAALGRMPGGVCFVLVGGESTLAAPSGKFQRVRGRQSGKYRRSMPISRFCVRCDLPVRHRGSGVQGAAAGGSGPRTMRACFEVWARRQWHC